MSDWLGLAGQTAAVTGGGSGIGKAVATELARVGCAVAVLDKNLAAAEAVAAELVAAGHKAQAFEIDTSQKAVVEACAANVVEALGAPTVLVNNAGILKPGPLETIDVEEWDALLKVNLTGWVETNFPGSQISNLTFILFRLIPATFWCHKHSSPE